MSIGVLHAPLVRKGLVTVLFLALLVQCFYLAWKTGQTADETYYNGSGYPIVRYNNYSFLGEHPPLVLQLGSIPLLFLSPRFPIKNPVYSSSSQNEIAITSTGSKFLYKMGNNPETLLFAERMMIVLLTLFLGYLLWRWSYEEFGVTSASITLTLYSFCPNLIAHGSLFTTDMAITVFFFALFFYLRLFFKQLTVKYVVAAGIAWGLALVSKISAVIAFPILIVLFFIAIHVKDCMSEIHHEKKIQKIALAVSLFLSILSLGNKLSLVALVPLTAISLSQIYQELATQNRGRKWRRVLLGTILISWGTCLVSVFLLKKYPFTTTFIFFIWIALGMAVSILIIRKGVNQRTQFFMNCLTVLISVSAMIIILDYMDYAHTLFRFNPFRHYMRTFNIALAHTTNIHSICVPGSFVTCDWKYFTGTLLTKTPLLTLTLSFIGVLSLFFLKTTWINRMVMILPPIIFLLWASFFNKIHIGLRHVLPVYPFLLLLAGLPFAKALWAKYRLRRAIGILFIPILGFHILRTLSQFPHYLSYVNEWVGSTEKGFNLLADSNMNWGQDNRHLTRFILKNHIPLVTILSPSMNPDEYDYYGIHWKPFQDSDRGQPQPGYYAFDAYTYLYGHEKIGWLGSVKPFARVGKTFYVIYIA